MNTPLHCAFVCALLAPGPARDREDNSTFARAPAVLLAPESALGAVQVCARGGRVVLVGSDGRVRALARDTNVESGGPAHLEAGAGAVVDIAWPELGSVQVAGPCVLEWDAPARTAAGPVLALRISALNRAEFEVRGATLALELPGGWRVTTSASAFGCAAASGGRVLVASHAGAALVVDGPRHGPALWPRRALGAGAELTLDTGAPPPARGDRCPDAPPWRRVEWPWGASLAPATRVTPEPAEPSRAEAPLSPDSPGVPR